MALISVLSLSLLTRSGSVEPEEPQFISPFGSVVRSAVLPGWGQLYVRNPIRGSLSLLGFGTFLTGAVVAHKSFQDIYNNGYVRAAAINPKSEESIAQYGRANERFKLRQFFLYTAVGVWMYSIIDSYVGANFYNATTKADLLIDETKQIEKLGVSVGIAPTQFHVSITNPF